MIDFRYHLVSLIAVFLALAVGIVLGAGPLRDTIGETLTGQVEDLRADREQLRADLAAAEADIEERTTYLRQSSGVLLADVLTDHRVAVVTLPETSQEDDEGVRESLSEAGAQVVGEAGVTEAWTDPDTRSFRQTFAGQLAGYLEHAPAPDATDERIFALALGAALTGANADGTVSEDAQTLLDLLTSADAPLVTLEGEITRAAEAVVLVGPRPADAPEADQPTADAEQAEQELAAYADLAGGLTGAAPGAVTVGAAVSDHDLVAAVRSGDDADAVTTVDSVGEVTAQLSVPLAVAVALSGGADAFGFQAGAREPIPPRVDLPAPSDAGTGGTDDEEPADG